MFKWYCIYKLDLCLEDFKAGTIWDNMPHSLQAWYIWMKFKYNHNSDMSYHNQKKNEGR